MNMEEIVKAFAEKPKDKERKLPKISKNFIKFVKKTKFFSVD